MLLMGLCFAQAESLEEVPAEAQNEEDLDGVEEVLVYGELRVIQARQRVEDRLEAGGYSMDIRKDDRTIYRHVAPYHGKVIIHDDGWMKVRRQGLRVEGREWEFAPRNSAKAWALCVVTPWRCVRVGGMLVSHRKFQNYRGEAVEGVGDDVAEWSVRIADLAIDRKLEAFDRTLRRLWTDGVPVEGSGRFGTAAERRAALLDYWASRTETVWGERVRDAVAAFIRGEIQYSSDPFTDEEMAAFNMGKAGRNRFAWVGLGIESSEPTSAVAAP
jgi:hypothetical protein